jgi:hypothetical protein
MSSTAKSEKDGPTPGRDRRFVTEQELLESLNRSLWEVERQRVEESRTGRTDL